MTKAFSLSQSDTQKNNIGDTDVHTNLVDRVSVGLVDLGLTREALYMAYSSGALTWEDLLGAFRAKQGGE